MNILVIGNGGREHALVDKISQSPLTDKIYVSPGNYGISLQATLVELNNNDNQEIMEFCQNKDISLVIIGPETALINGLSDALQALGIKVLGPTKKAAQIESSKVYAKEIMAKYDIPTAKYQKFNDYELALDYIELYDTYPVVIKYDGLAAGKGVYIVDKFDDAHLILNDLLIDRLLGDEGIIIEEFLDGDEFTLLALVKDNTVYPFQIARDFKRVFDHDQGLNTGGMGAICPYDNISKTHQQQAIEILQQTADALVQEENNFSGVLYGGFIQTKAGIKVIEYNARFGDPETQCVLNNLQSDLVENILDLLDNKEVKLSFKKLTSVGLVLSAPGYPQAYEKNINVEEYLALPFTIYHMQTKYEDYEILSNGGRVLFILNSAQNSQDGFKEIYHSMAGIQNNVLHYRHDLGEF